MSIPLRTSYEAPSYVIYKDDGGFYYAKNGRTGNIEYGGPNNVGGVSGTDASTIIQTVVDVLGLNGGEIFFKKGTYTLLTSISLTWDKHRNIHFIGEGARNTVLKAGNLNVILFNCIGTAIDDIHEMQYFSWRRLSFEGGGSGGTSEAIHIEYGHYNVISECWFTEFGTNRAVYWENIDNSWITNCWFFLNRGHGFQTYGNCGENCILGSQFEDNEGDGMYLQDCYDNSIIGNQVTGNSGSGISVIAGDRNKFLGNLVEGNAEHGFNIIGGIRHVISGNTISDNDSANTASYDGIYLYNSNDIIVAENMFLDNDRYEIYVRYNCNRITIVHNRFPGTDHVGIIQDDGVDSTILDNVEFLTKNKATASVTIPIGGGTATYEMTAAALGLDTGRVTAILNVRVYQSDPETYLIYEPRYGINAAENAVGLTLAAGIGTTLSFEVYAEG